MKKAGYIFTLLINCTWGIIQSFLGLVLFLVFIMKPHFWYKGSVVTVDAAFKSTKIRGGVALGLFIFTTLGIEKEQIASNSLIQHEYGHVIQSALLGPFFLLIVGLPSLIWARVFASWRKKHNKDYYSFYTESWADKWGKKETGVTL